jgi:hypothetical protein
LALGDGLLRIRAIDSGWHETLLGPPRAGTPFPVAHATRRLAPGETRRYTVRLGPADAAFLAKPGVVHLLVDGGSLGAADSNRITIRIGA